MKLKAIIVAGVALCAAAQGAVTVSIKNFTAANVGTPIVNSAGVPLDQGQFFAAAGFFGGSIDFGSASVSQILEAFTSLDDTPVAANANFDGLFSANDISNVPYVSGAQGSRAYILIGNAATLSASTAIAVYDSGVLFPEVDGAGNALLAINGTTPGNWVVGALTPVTVQPTLNGAAYTTGVQLVPEPSAALLGLLGAVGLIRRRR